MRRSPGQQPGPGPWSGRLERGVGPQDWGHETAPQGRPPPEDEGAPGVLGDGQGPRTDRDLDRQPRVAGQPSHRERVVCAPSTKEPQGKGTLPHTRETE